MIKIITLNGNKETMGLEYGYSLKDELREVYNILAEYFYIENNYSEDDISCIANNFFHKFPTRDQQFIEGIARGSNININKIKIINAMEVIYGQLCSKQNVQGCSFVALKDANGNNKFLGRNYDYSPPFDKISQFLCLTILNETGYVPTCAIAMAGQAYAPTCFNKNSLFLAFNNGMPSGGFKLKNTTQTILIKLLNSMQTSNCLKELKNNLNLIDSDYSLIVNIADKENIISFEYSSIEKHKMLIPSRNEIFASTNFFLSADWKLTEPKDEDTWQGVSRRNNLLLLNKYNSSPSALKEKLNKDVTENGAAIENTIYQIIYDFELQKLYVKLRNYSIWQEYYVNKLFS